MNSNVQINLFLRCGESFRVDKFFRRRRRLEDAITREVKLLLEYKGAMRTLQAAIKRAKCDPPRVVGDTGARSMGALLPHG